MAEMKEWVALGGGNSGCCGNNAHTYGFHREATSVPSSDYSRRHESAKPYNMNWGCAGDFHHGFKPALMAKHAQVLQRLMRGEFPMICEMITKPWANKPVYYWARWNGIGTLQRYTGSGHDHWSHISWWRSKANQRAHLWTPASSSATEVTPTAGTTAPKYPGYALKRNDTKKDANVRVFQNQAKARGAKISVDSVFGPGTQTFVKAFQKANTAVAGTADGVVGPKTWAALWNTKTKVA